MLALVLQWVLTSLCRVVGGACPQSGTPVVQQALADVQARIRIASGGLKGSGTVGSGTTAAASAGGAGGGGSTAVDGDAPTMLPHDVHMAFEGANDTKVLAAPAPICPPQPPMHRAGCTASLLCVRDASV